MIIFIFFLASFDLPHCTLSDFFSQKETKRKKVDRIIQDSGEEGPKYICLLIFLPVKHILSW